MWTSISFICVVIVIAYTFHTNMTTKLNSLNGAKHSHNPSKLDVELQKYKKSCECYIRMRKNEQIFVKGIIDKHNLAIVVPEYTEVDLDSLTIEQLMQLEDLECERMNTVRNIIHKIGTD